VGSTPEGRPRPRGSLSAILSPGEARVLADFKGGLVSRFGARLASLVLCDSWAREESHESSDLDVFVLIDGLTRPSGVTSSTSRSISNSRRGSSSRPSSATRAGRR
jgi:hypothetical protein